MFSRYTSGAWQRGYWDYIGPFSLDLYILLNRGLNTIACPRGLFFPKYTPQVSHNSNSLHGITTNTRLESTHSQWLPLPSS